MSQTEVSMLPGQIPIYYERNGVHVTISMDDYDRPTMSFQTGTDSQEEFCRSWVDATQKEIIKSYNFGLRSFKGKLAPGYCDYCLRFCDDLSRDHIVPVSKGGDDDPNNIAKACKSCNSRKHAKSLLQFVREVAS